MTALVAKACPVVLREGTEGTEILVFEHPLAGIQIVKGTIEPGETEQAAALRELAEESGLRDGRVIRTLGQSADIDDGQVWTFVLVEARNLPNAWVFHTLDDGGHDFAFFWHQLNAEPDARWHPIFLPALAFIRSRLAD